MYLTETLISEIQNYPCLWDMGSKDYSDKDQLNFDEIKHKLVQYLQYHIILN